ncbi:hypothetical protein MBLNU459_g3209t1 [Dothideomycetes sp. NU459]
MDSPVTLVFRDKTGFDAEYVNDKTRILLTNLRLKAILRTLLRRPELAAHFKHVVLRQFDHPGQLVDRLNHDCFPPDKDLARMYRRFSSLTSLGEQHESWLASLYAGDEVAELTLLQSLARNVTEVQCLFPAWPGSTPLPFYRAFLLEATKPRYESGPSRGIYTRVERVTISNWTSEDMATGMPLWCLSEFMLLPTLKRIVFNGAREEEDLGRWFCPERASRTAELHLTNSLVKTGGLELFIDSCAELKIFNLSYTRRSAFDHFGPRDVDWQRVGDSLRGQSLTLEELTLDAEDQSPLSIAPWMEFRHPIGSLRNFAALRTICVHQWILLGRDVWYEAEGTERDPIALLHVLPESLVKLSILQCTPSIIPQLLTLQYAVSEQAYRNLSVVNVDWEKRYEEVLRGPNLDFRLEHLARNFEASGVAWHESNRPLFRPDLSLAKYSPFWSS